MNLLKKENLKNMDSSSRNEILSMNLTISFTNKFLSVFLSYLLVPLTITYLNQEVYGVWLTLFSMLSWLTFCDIGLGNGLRNKLTECLSKGDKKNARKYISTAYVVISIIVTLIFILSLFTIHLVHWNKVLNTKLISNRDLITLVYITTIFFLINFILSIINQIYYSYQKSMFVGFGQIVSNIIVIVGIVILKELDMKNIVYLATLYGGANILKNIIFSIIFFRTNKDVAPSIREFSKSKVSDILTLGIRFFVIQIATIVVFTTDNIVITQIAGPKYVTGYNIVQKLFGALTMFHTILVTPLWSAYTDAYVKKDYKWIRGAIRKLNILMIPIILSTVIIYFCFNFIIELWVKQTVSISKSLIILIAIYTIISIWNNIYSYFLNGIGFLKISFWNCILIAIVNIPLSLYFAKYLSIGVNGVVISNIVCLLIGAIIQPIQTYSILNNKVPNSIFYK